MVRGFRTLLVALLVALASVTLLQAPAGATVRITFGASSTLLTQGGVVTFSGVAKRAKLGSYVVLQRWHAGAWHRVVRHELVTSRRFVFRVTPPLGGSSYRVRKPRALGQGAAASRKIALTVRTGSIATSVPPSSFTVVPLKFNEANTIHGLDTDADGYSWMSFDAEAGQLISATWGDAVIAPDGSFVDWVTLRQYGIRTFWAPMAGKYLLRHYLFDPAERNADLTVWLTTPKVEPWDGWCCDLDQDLPGQVLEVRVAAHDGDMFYLTEDLNDEPDIAVGVPRFVGPDESQEASVYYAESRNEGFAEREQLFRIHGDGTRILRYLPKDAAVLLHLNPVLQLVATYDVAVDGPSVWVQRQDIPGVARARFEATGGQLLLVHYASAGFGELIDPSGQIVGTGYQQTCMVAPESGTYDFAVWSDTYFSVEPVAHCP